MDRTSTLSGLTMATPISGRPPPRGKPLRVTPYGLHPPRLAAHLWTYTTSRDINPPACPPESQRSPIEPDSLENTDMRKTLAALTAGTLAALAGCAVLDAPDAARVAT